MNKSTALHHTCGSTLRTELDSMRVKAHLSLNPLITVIGMFARLLIMMLFASAVLEFGLFDKMSIFLWENLLWCSHIGFWIVLTIRTH